jgi:hypothetical protein
MEHRVAIAWLREIDWPLWQTLDPGLPPYSRWVEEITEAMADVALKGVTPEKVVVDPQAFLDWCRDSGRPVGRNSLAAYASLRLPKRRE